MNAPTYGEIRRLADDLRKETRVRARRDLGIALHNRLKDETTLRKLAVEATPDETNWPEEDSVAARRSRALSGMWSAVVQGAINVPESILAAKKVKLTEHDVKLPYQMLVACDKSKEILADPSIAIPMLSRKTVRGLMKYSLAFLGDDEAVTVGRHELLKTLTLLCSRSEYVGSFKYHNDFASILEELNAYLSPEVADEHPPYFEEAAEALANLFSTTECLGIQMHIFINDTTHRISAVIESYLNDPRKMDRPQSPALLHLYRTLASMLSTHPDHSVGPMTRFGRSIIRHARKCYPKARNAFKTSLNSFLLALLKLSQYAGTLQGRVAGHMGQLGKASLTAELLNNLLDIVMRDMHHFFGKSLSTQQIRKRSVSWSPLSFLQRQHLELASRLLASAQQEFLSKTQWDTVTDITTALRSYLPTCAEDGVWVNREVTKPKDCPTESFTSSPWMRHVLLPLARVVDWQAFSHKYAQTEHSNSESTGLTPSADDYMRKFPFLARVVNAPTVEPIPTLAYLPVIGAAAELFPAGQCWTSNIFDGWKTLVPKDQLSNDVLLCQRCTVNDFALLVFLLAACLEEHGGPDGSCETQAWIVVTLSRLTHPTALFYRHTPTASQKSLALLADSWRLVWQIIFRGDLRYSDYTRDASSLSLGELVLSLVRDITQHNCTDPAFLLHVEAKDKQLSFLHRNQSNVWNMPVFRHAFSVASYVPLELTAWICQNAGLSEAGSDRIDPMVSQHWADYHEIVDSRHTGGTASRRYRLICFALAIMDFYLQKKESISREIVHAATGAVITLMRGKIPSRNFMEGIRSYVRSSAIGCTTDALFRLTTVKTPTMTNGEGIEWRDQCVQILWNRRNQCAFSSNHHMCTEVDVPYDLMVLYLYRSDICDVPNSLDFVSESEIADLCHFIQKCMRGKIMSTMRFQMGNLENFDDDEIEQRHSCGSSLDTPLVNESLALKALLSVQFLTLHLDDRRLLEEAANRMARCFQSVHAFSSQSSLLEAVADHRQIFTSFLELLSESTTGIFLPGLQRIPETCRSILLAYLQRLSDGSTDAISSRTKEERSRSRNDDFLEDDVQENLPIQGQQLALAPTSFSMDHSSSDDDSQVRNRLKRKRSLSTGPIGREKIVRGEGKSQCPPNFPFAVEIARLLLVFEPSCSNRELVCRALLGADPDLDPLDLDGDLDLRGARPCLDLLISQDAVLHEIGKKNVLRTEVSGAAACEVPSVQLLHNVIDMIRVNAGPSYILQVNGYEECAIHVAEILRHRGQRTDKEMQIIRDTLMSRQNIDNVPQLRACRIRAVSSAFRNADTAFHGVLDQQFPGFVKNAMIDPDRLVRRRAHEGVKLALALLDEQKVLNSIKLLLVPISTSQGAKEKHGLLDEWCKQNGCNLLHADGFGEIETRDLHQVMEADSLYLRAVVAASVTANDIFLDLIFEICIIPVTRPELEFLCLGVLDRIARLREYGSVEAMIGSESIPLMHRWVKSEYERLPLLLTAPAIVRRMSHSTGARGWNGHRVDAEDLKDDAFHTYMLKNIQFLVPLSFLQSVASVPHSYWEADGGNDEEALTVVSDEPKLRLLATSITSEADDIGAMKGIKRLLHKSAVEIRSFTYILHQCGEAKFGTLADKALRILASILSIDGVDKRTRRKVDSTVRGIIDLAAAAEFLPTVIPLHQGAYYDAIVAAIQDYCGSMNLTGDKLRYVGTNTIACLINSLKQLENAIVPIRKTARWKAISLQLELIKGQVENSIEKHTNVAFSIHVLTELLLKEKFSLLRPAVLLSLQELLEDAIRDSKREDVEFQSLIKRLIGAAFHVHECCQRKILESERVQRTEFRRRLTRSCGLAVLCRPQNRGSSVWGWETSLSEQQVFSKSLLHRLASDDTQRTITGTYRIIEWVFDHATNLALDSVAFVPVAPPYAIRNCDLGILSAADKSFAIQLLALRRLEEPGMARTGGMEVLPALSTELDLKLKNRQAWVTTDENSDTQVMLSSLNLDQRLILALLGEVERELAKRYQEYQKTDRASNTCFPSLIACLSCICTAPCPEILRVAAGRCLGKLEVQEAFRHSEWKDSITPRLWAPASSATEDVLRVAESSCLEILTSCLMASNPIIAEIASDALGALLPTKRGREAMSCVQYGFAKSQLELYQSQYTRNDLRRSKQATLSDVELDALFRKTGSLGRDIKEYQWCWAEEVWLSYELECVTFEEWVCTLTAALIVCSVPLRADEQNRQRDSDGEFFWLCQRICAFEHNTACIIFPFLVLYLLVFAGDGEELDFSRLLTKSFDTILRRSCSRSTVVESESSRKVLELIIDTLNLLREFSQTSFISREHPRNVCTVRERRTPPKSKDNPKGHNFGIPESPPWGGVQYGVILKLDGLTVASACVRVRRYASALFFLDLHLNARFGKSGDLFDEFTGMTAQGMTSSEPAFDISGVVHINRETFEQEDQEKSILKAMSIAADCYKFLNEHAALEAVDMQSSAIDMRDFGKGVAHPRQRSGEPIDLLRSLNNNSGSQESVMAMEVVDSMESLEFHALLRSYIDGMFSDTAVVQSLNDDDIAFLKEKWHEKKLRRQSWDLLEPETAAISSSLSTEDSLICRSGSAVQSKFSQRGGYFEAIAAALESYQSDDIALCKAHLNDARRAVVREVKKVGGLESPTSGMVEIVNKFRHLDFLERVWAPNIEAAEMEELRLGTDFGSFLDLMANCLQESTVVTPTPADEVSMSTDWLPELGLSAAYAKKCIDRRPQRNLLLEQLASRICSNVVRSRLIGKSHTAAESVQRLHRLLAAGGQSRGSEAEDQIVLLHLEETKVLECQGDFKNAVRKSQQIVDRLLHRERTSGTLTSQMQYAVAEAQLSCGSWLTKYKVQQARHVVEGYLKPGADRSKLLYESNSTPENAERTVKASLALGQIVSNLHRALLSRVRSTEWKRSSSTAHHIQELKRCEPLLEDADRKRKKTKKTSPQFEIASRKWEELFIYCEHLRKDLRRTNDERQSVFHSMRQYLVLAVESYTRALALASTGAQEDLLRHVSDFMSLWFANSKMPDEREADINQSMKEAFALIPSYRFVPLTNQLFSRIEDSNDSRSSDFQAVLQGLVFKMCADHPYHCIISLVALANGKKVGSGVGGRSASDYIQNVGDSKVTPANAIMTRLEKEAHPYVVGVLQSYVLLSDAYIHLAEAETASFHKKLTKNIPFAKLSPSPTKSLDRCLGKGASAIEFPPAIFTSPPTLQPSGDYGEGIDDPIGGERVRGFESVFGITETGLHRPKIVVCLGTRGGEFRQLVKGEDEIRQDAIMSQVFRFVNGLMQRRLATADNKKSASKAFRHELRVATYSIVPLSPASGVLEWVENTAAFGDVVTGRGSRHKDFGLHARYYPKEWSHLLCRTHINDSPPEQKRETYDVICRHFSPCFRFFFIENFGHNMTEWHSAKMKYTRSVAVSSMVGHILGIGDRHISNILVHTRTGELVHIDFGIVFEQGKLLATPERVPFRLTRNMVDGMGPCGTEGTFVRSSEETIRVLRNNASTLLTILSAVVADPLYKWSVSPVEGLRRQRRASEVEADIQSAANPGAMVTGDEMLDDQNEMGRKTIAKISDKLQGYEDSTSGEQQGVEGQVQLLINSARDADNLCLMYPGWSPWV